MKCSTILALRKKYAGPSTEFSDLQDIVKFADQDKIHTDGYETDSPPEPKRMKTRTFEYEAALDNDFTYGT